MDSAIHTSDIRNFKRLWSRCGGSIRPINRTGEVLYVHAHFAAGIRVNGRRKDVPAKLLSRLNSIIRYEAANDPDWHIKA